MTVPRNAVLVACSFFLVPLGAALGQPRGLGGNPGGLGAASGLLKVDPKVVAVETALLELVNELRQKKNRAPMVMSARLRALMRTESVMAANGDPMAAKIHERIKAQGMAPYGYMVQAAYGSTAQELFTSVKKDKNMTQAMVEEYATAGIGAFWVPAEPPYFQVTVLIAQEPDPMAGKPGLAKSQTDPVMNAAMPSVKQCYDRALERNPNLSGNMMVKIVIGAGGKVTEAETRQSFGDVELDVCVLTLVRALEFPAPYKDKPVTLHHPFKLTPPQGSRRLGVLSDTQLNGVFSRARPAFRRCYDHRLEEKPKLAGSLTLTLTVLPTGATTQVRISADDIHDEVLTACILELAKELRFPQPKFEGEVDVTYPLSFSPPTKD